MSKVILVLYQVTPGYELANTQRYHLQSHSVLRHMASTVHKKLHDEAKVVVSWH